MPWLDALESCDVSHLLYNKQCEDENKRKHVTRVGAAICPQLTHDKHSKKINFHSDS